MASHGANATSYDVFLSFRGEDTRNTFTDHLYEALVRAGLHTFRDNNEILKGEDLQHEIERAIKASKTSIIVLSDTYATSAWCLDELSLILEQKRESNHFVLPVFYHVDPSDVRKQTSSFAIKVKASTRWTRDNVNRWKACLTNVSMLSGEVVSGPETRSIKNILDTIYHQLDKKYAYLPPNYIIGMRARHGKIIDSWLVQSDTNILIIYGMGGSGKKTLAKHIVDSNCHKFENISIVEEIDGRCKQPHDLVKLQKKILKDILGRKKTKILGDWQVRSKIKEVLSTMKALVVLDNIVDDNQLEALLGTRDINKESKIIITTRGNNLNSIIWKHWTYQMQLLHHNESIELLSLHAFGSKIPLEGYEELAEQVVRYCKGNPLALELLGSCLAEDNCILSWKSVLNKLEKDILHDGIYRVLIRGYELLPFDSDRELFLHIACFFTDEDMDYVVKILEHEFYAISRIHILIKRCLLSITPNQKLTMHPLLRDMARSIVFRESPKDPALRSRVWCNEESYELLRNGKGSKTVEGLALDMQMLRKEKYAFKESDLSTDAFKNMDKLKFLYLKFVQLRGSYDNFPKPLRCLCWIGCHLNTIPCNLFMGDLVALDMSYSCLEVFEPPMVLQSLKFLNLKDSHNLLKIYNICHLPNLEHLSLWNCHSLVYICETIGGLKSLALLNMTGCENMFINSWKKRLINPLKKLKDSLFGGGSTQQPWLTLPRSLKRVFLKDCNLESTNYFPLGFNDQSFLQYINLRNSLFEVLPSYNHLGNLRVLDLSSCSRLTCLLCLPNTLEELYVYHCESLEKITFKSQRFTLQELGYEGCIKLSEIEGLMKLVPVAKLDENDLGHMKWIKEYLNQEVRLVGDDELTKSRSQCVQVLYEFGIVSISLLDIQDSNVMAPLYISESSSLSFNVPYCPENMRLKGLNVTFRYTISGCQDLVWFAKISMTTGVKLMYTPKVFGKPESGEVGVWSSYWPIGNTINIGDEVNVSIVVMSGLEVHECGASIVYTDDVDIMDETLRYNSMGWVETLGGDLSRFQLSTGAYYLCRHDFFKLIEVGRLSPGWLSILVGDTVDDKEILGWRNTGRSFTAR